MPSRLLIRCLWPISVALIATALLGVAQLLPSWVLAAVAFTAGAISVAWAARNFFGRRTAELEATKRLLEQDIAEIRRLEQQRNELYAELLHAQKLEALGTLAGGVAHDLNNTLVPVLSLMKLVMAKLQPGSREYASAEMILTAGRRARDLVRQVLAFSRKSMAERKPVALHELVGNSLQKIRPSLPTGIEIEQHLTGVPPVLADRAQLEQVLAALLTNSAQAITNGVGTITVEVAEEGERSSARLQSGADVPGVRLTVRDTGCGMDAVTKRRVFEPFFTTKEIGRGTGLGLAVAHGIIAGHGGEIAVESEPGVGTRFDIFLPGIAAEASAASLSAAAD